MAILPIDLQNMYSQMSNVAKSVGGQQNASQLAGSIQQMTQGEKLAQENTKVQSASNDKADSRSINADGKNGSNNSGYQNQKREHGKYENEGNNNSYSAEKSVNPYLGSIIDITR